FDLRCNLTELFLSHGVDVELPEGVQKQLHQYFQDSVGTKTNANQLVRHAAKQLQVDECHVLDVLKQGVWNRKIRVDLFRPFLLDKPLRVEVQDPLVVYGDWFARGYTTSTSWAISHCQ